MNPPPPFAVLADDAELDVEAGVDAVAWLALGGDCRKNRSGTTALRSFRVRLGGTFLSSPGVGTKPAPSSPITTDSEGGDDD
jgi:hypothetical protein